jgi:hypothetical protein
MEGNTGASNTGSGLFVVGIIGSEEDKDEVNDETVAMSLDDDTSLNTSVCTLDDIVNTIVCVCISLVKGGDAGVGVDVGMGTCELALTSSGGGVCKPDGLGDSNFATMEAIRSPRTMFFRMCCRCGC